MIPEDIVEKMYINDAFSQWLGIEILDRGPGQSKLQMTVRHEMCNGFAVAHGGITYSLADSALAFASNSHGLKSMSIETSIAHIQPVYIGDVLIAEAAEVNKSNRLARYDIRIYNQSEDLVAKFQGTVFRSQKTW